MGRDINTPFHGWLLIAGVLAFGAYLLWSFGLIHQVVRDDITYISLFILCLFTGVTVYLGFGAWELSRQTRLARQLGQPGADGAWSDPDSWAAEYRQLMQRGRARESSESESLLARLVEQVHRGHASGWFLSDMLMRLGLIGTVIGFVLMLGSVYELETSDIDSLRQLLTTMGSGMQVALYTTLTGLGSALLVGIQCQWLDRCADNLVSEIIRLGVGEG